MSKKQCKEKISGIKTRMSGLVSPVPKSKEKSFIVIKSLSSIGTGLQIPKIMRCGLKIHNDNGVHRQTTAEINNIRP